MVVLYMIMKGKMNCFIFKFFVKVINSRFIKISRIILVMIIVICVFWVGVII